MATMPRGVVYSSPLPAAATSAPPVVAPPQSASSLTPMKYASSRFVCALLSAARLILIGAVVAIVITASGIFILPMMQARRFGYLIRASFSAHAHSRIKQKAGPMKGGKKSSSKKVQEEEEDEESEEEEEDEKPVRKAAAKPPAKKGAKEEVEEEDEEEEEGEEGDDDEGDGEDEDDDDDIDEFDDLPEKECVVRSLLLALLLLLLCGLFMSCLPGSIACSLLLPSLAFRISLFLWPPRSPSLTRLPSATAR